MQDASLNTSSLFNRHIEQFPKTYLTTLATMIFVRSWLNTLRYKEHNYPILQRLSTQMKYTKQLRQNDSYTMSEFLKVC